MTQIGQNYSLSIVIPAKNEAENLKRFLPRLLAVVVDAEVIVVNDGSTDDTLSICEQHDVTVVTHPYSKGNGAAIKTGARTAKGEVIVFMDGDGQHKPEDISQMLEKLATGYDMAVGARDKQSQADSFRAIASSVYNWLSSAITGHKILDLTSGFGAVKADKFKEFLYLLPNGFYYPTTSTMAFSRAGYSVGYIPIQTEQRLGESYISLLKDGIRFLLIIFKVGTLYSPLKIFLPIAVGFFGIGVINYIYTYTTQSTFTNMSAVLLMTGIIIFLFGLVSEQVTALMYKDSDRD
jgi:glycosyltransferase involved in cell wall biosynthesis